MMKDFNIPEDLTALSVDDAKDLAVKAREHVASLREGTIADKLEAKRLLGQVKTIDALVASAEIVEEEAEVEAVEAPKAEVDEVVEAEETTEEETVETTEDIVEAVETPEAPLEASETVVEDVVAQTASITEIQDMKQRFNGKDKQTIKKSFNVAAADVTGLGAEETTKKIASLPTPHMTGLTGLQKALGVKTAATCEPGEVLRQAFSCGRYVPTISGLFRTVVTNSMKVVWHSNFDASQMVSEADLNADPILKDCYDYTCNDANELTMREVVSCFTMNEQVNFSSDLAVQTLIDEGNSYLAAKLDSIILEQMDTYMHPFSFAGTGRGFGDVSLGVAETIRQIEQASPLTNSADSVVLITKGMLAYLASDNYSRNHSWSAQEYVSELFGGRRVVEFDPYIDPTLTPTTLPAPGGAAQALTVNTDWLVRIINPDDAFQIVRSENQYGIQEVAPSMTEVRGNKIGYFARAYTNLGLLQNCGWASIDFSNICVGNRAAADATC